MVDGRLKEWGSGGRDIETHTARLKELQSTEIKASQITQQAMPTPTRESIGYTASGRKRLQELRNKMQDVFVSSTQN